MGEDFVKNHHWKRLFYLLLGVNIAAIVIILALLNIPLEEPAIPNNEMNDGDRVSFEIKTNKNDVNQLINHYIKKESSTEFAYKVYLAEKEVIFLGELPLLGMVIDLKMTFQPSALNNGDLLLEQHSFSLGRIQLPVPVLLKIIQESYQFPEWITIQPNQQRIYVSFNRMSLENDNRIKVKAFDLENDRLEFLFEVPVN